MGVFDGKRDELFVTHRARLRFRDKLMGGIPGDPAIIEPWIITKVFGGDRSEEAMLYVVRTLRELGADVPDQPTPEDIERAADSLAERRHTNGFKRDENGLFIESRQIKAGLKESMNILFAGTRMGATKKGAKSFLAERVFVNPDRIYLGRQEQDGVDLSIGHVTGPQGPRSTLTYYQYVERGEVEFDVMVAKAAEKEIKWDLLWLHLQENGFGALRSQGHGRFDIVKWDDMEEGQKAAPQRATSKRALAEAAD